MLWQPANSDGSQEYQRRSGRALSPEQLWIDCCAARNRAVAAAARAVAENADLARALAERARMLGNDALAARLQEEAQSEERHVGQILKMLEGLGMDGA